METTGGDGADASDEEEEEDGGGQDDRTELGEGSDDDDDDDVPPPKKKKRDPSCTENFVINTRYKLQSFDSEKVFATASLVDPSPALPKSLSSKHSAGDYVLLSGDAIIPASKVNVTFEPNQQLILTKNWKLFKQDMTVADLIALGKVQFHLWWQCIVPPKPPSDGKATIKATVAHSKTVSKGKRKR